MVMQMATLTPIPTRMVMQMATLTRIPTRMVMQTLTRMETLTRMVVLHLVTALLDSSVPSSIPVVSPLAKKITTVQKDCGVTTRAYVFPLMTLRAMGLATAATAM
jgi:hypothetical protein